MNEKRYLSHQEKSKMLERNENEGLRSCPRVQERVHEQPDFFQNFSLLSPQLRSDFYEMAEEK